MRMSQRLGQRSEAGLYLVELLIAVFISSLFAASLMGNIAQTSRIATGGENQVIAADIAQELIDNARNTSWTTLSSYVGSGPQTMLINKTVAGQVGPGPDTRPLLLDISQKTQSSWEQGMNTSVTYSSDTGSQWSDPTVRSSFGSSNNATVTETVATGSYANTLLVTIAINWQEGPATKSYTIQTLICEYGIHN